MATEDTMVIVWFLCGVFNWGATLGEFVGEFPQPPHRRHYGVAGFTALMGPAGTIACALCSNFFQHGFVWK
jgi:hypothetical protein